MFLIRLTYLSCALLAGVLTLSPARDATAATSAALRTETPLIRDWRFAFGDSHTEKPDLDDSAWQSVSLPHSWNRIGGLGVKAANANDQRGQGWYRLRFDAGSAVAKPRRSYLQFDGASVVSDVWLNGKLLGRHHGGVSGFRFEVSDVISTGSNLLVVRTDNSAPEAKGSVTAETLPMGGDWFMYGGLYRKVSLITADPVHIDLGDYAGPGVYARTVSLAKDAAEVEVKTRLRNQGGQQASLTIRTTVLDARGRSVTAATRELSLGVGAASESLVHMTVPKPRLWNGIADPYLYRVRVDVLVSGRRVDSVTQPLGIRTMRFDPDQGFFLNGNKLVLKGVNRHQETGLNGWASTDAELERDYAIIKEMGANSVRLAHYQHAQAEYDLADRTGLIVWAEMPLVLLSAPYGQPTATPAFIANAEQHLLELVRQNYNHASIAAWSVANEPNIGSLWFPMKPPTVPLLERLVAIARIEDPSRPAVLASCCGTLPGDLMPDKKGAGLDSPPQAVDVFGVNVYFGWYYLQAADLGAYLDKLHAFYPGKSLSVTEYGAGGALTQHTDNPLAAPVNAYGRPHPEGFQSSVHEQTWPLLRARSYLWGSWLWNMFDFGSASRQEGDLVDTNDKGIVSFDRTVRKEAFYYYKAQWNPQPMIYLAGHRYIDRASPVADIKAYTNAPTAKLVLNGKAYGSATCPDRICTWPKVALVQGNNVVQVEATLGGKELVDRAHWRRADGPGTYRILAGQLAVTKTSAGLYGSDNFVSGGYGRFLNPPSFGKPPVPTLVADAVDQQLYLTYRAGRFSYALPLPNGEYVVTLRFLEPDPKAGPGARVFDVEVQGDPVLRDLDIAATVGTLTAYERVVPMRVIDGIGRIGFVPKAGEAILSSLGIAPR